MAEMTTLLTRQAQAFAIVLGLACFAIANRLWEIDQAATDHAGFIQGVWPWWFAAAGITTLLWAARPDSRCLLMFSGAFVVSAMVSRAMSTVLQITEAAAVLSSPQLHVAGIVWTCLAGACAYLWLTDFRAVNALVGHRWQRDERSGDWRGDASGDADGPGNGGYC